MITLRQLHYFVTVAEEGKLTGAARRLYVAQPALSQAVPDRNVQLRPLRSERLAVMASASHRIAGHAVDGSIRS